MIVFVHRDFAAHIACANFLQLVEAFVAELVQKINEVAKLLVSSLNQEESHFTTLQENFEILHRTC